MKRISSLVFSERISANVVAPEYFLTSSVFYTTLGAIDKLVIQRNAYNIFGTPVVWVQIMHSNDGGNWIRKNALPEVLPDYVMNSPTAVGADPGTKPSLAFVRLLIGIGSEVGTSGCTLEIYVTGRDTSEEPAVRRVQLRRGGGRAVARRE